MIMTIKAEIEHLSVFGTVKNIYFFGWKFTSSLVNSFLHSHKCKYDIRYWFVSIPTWIKKSGRGLQPLQEKKKHKEKCNLYLQTQQKENKLPSSYDLL